MITRKPGNRKPTLDLIYEWSNKHEAQQLCSVNRPISLNTRLNNLLSKLFAVCRLPILQFSDYHCILLNNLYVV